MYHHHNVNSRKNTPKKDFATGNTFFCKGCTWNVAMEKVNNYDA